MHGRKLVAERRLVVADGAIAGQEGESVMVWQVVGKVHVQVCIDQIPVVHALHGTVLW
jgi:hypothetical protein